MSFADLVSAFQPDKQIALVKKITEKTQQGKIAWQKMPNGIGANITGRLRLNFVEQPWPLIGSTRWVIFVVRDDSGSEVLKAENKTASVPGLTPPPAIEQPANPNMAWLSLLATDPLTDAVTELHNLVLKQTPKSGIDRAIDMLNNI